MTPNEIYALPTLSVEPWHKDYAEVLRDVLKLDYLEIGNPVHEEIDTRQLLIHDKLSYTSDGSRGVNVYAFTLDDVPFAVMFTGGRSGQDAREFFVTDTATWKDARGYVQSAMNHVATVDLPTAQENTELIKRFYDATFVKMDEGYRVVSNQHAHPISGALIYDQEKFAEAWRKATRKGASSQAKDDTAKTRDAIVKVCQAGVVGVALHLNTRLSESQQLFAVSLVDDVTFAHVCDLRRSSAGWGSNMVTHMAAHMVGPGSMFECYAEVAAGRNIDVDFSYVRDAAKTFNLPPEYVVKELSSFIWNGGKGVAERLIALLPRDERVSDVMEQDYSTVALAYQVIDNPDVSRFSPSATGKWAESIIAMTDTITERTVKQATPCL